MSLMRRPLIILLVFILPGCWEFPEELLLPRHDISGSTLDQGEQPDMAQDMLEDMPETPDMDMTEPQPDLSKLDTMADQTPPDITPPDAKPLLALGKSCGAGSQCNSGFCVDKVCCDKKCTSKCFYCALSASKGKCTLVPSGQDPNDDCVKQGFCAQNGFCNGKGLCYMPPAGTVCKAAACQIAVPTKITLAGVCTKAHKCVQLNTTRGEISCGSYLCNKAKARCYGPCTGTAQCKAGKTCGAKKCGGAKLPLGAPCGNKGECASSKCVDKVCCDSDCTGKDEICNQIGAWGRCFDLKSGK